MRGWYYLHTNGNLIFKRDLDDGQAADFRESDFVRMFWSFDTENRADAWRVLVEALALGADKKRVAELANKWGCDNEDAPDYASHIGAAIKRDGTAICVHAKKFTNLQECQAGFGDTALEAFAALAKQLGFKASKMWGRSFASLIDAENAKPRCDAPPV